jgi:ABC-type uncharacterized transport system substrate-binding protein
MSRIRRRAFIAGLGSAAAWPMVARAQQGERIRRIGMLMAGDGGDPIASGMVSRLDRPGGNVTGFATLEASLGGKWLELLSEIAPGLKRAAIIFNPDTAIANASAYMPSFETSAVSLKIELSAALVHSDLEIEAAIVALGHEPRGGLVVMPDIFTTLHRKQIILAAAPNNVPAIYGLATSRRKIDAISIVTMACNNAKPAGNDRRAWFWSDRATARRSPAV